MAPYYAAIGLTLGPYGKILRRCSTGCMSGSIPGAIILGSLLGWFMAGRALTPVLAVAQTAHADLGGRT
jgi:hypothetical protein